ncbi:MAG: hypothetical protein LBI68_08815 [Azoarcus sp.]|nr:hypothetical protein [Azoarcus sp.]
MSFSLVGIKKTQKHQGAAEQFPSVRAEALLKSLGHVECHSTGQGRTGLSRASLAITMPGIFFVENHCITRALAMDMLRKQQLSAENSTLAGFGEAVSAMLIYKFKQIGSGLYFF